MAREDVQDTVEQTEAPQAEPSRPSRKRVSRQQQEGQGAPLKRLRRSGGDAQVAATDQPDGQLPAPGGAAAAAGDEQPAPAGVQAAPAATAPAAGPAAVTAKQQQDREKQAERQRQKEAEAAAVKAQLLEAHEVFVEHAAQRQLFLEVDCAKLAPATLVGRQVRVLWPEDAAWYLGTVAEYDKATGEHTIHYADGERERVALALERVRLLVHAGEALAAAPPPVLVTYAVKLQGLAGLPQYHSQRTALQQRARELQALAQTLEPLHAQERRRASQQLLRSMSGAGAGTAGTTPASTAGAGASSGVHQAPGQPPKKGGPAPGEQAQAQQPAEACAQQPGKDEPQNTAATAERQAQETAAAADQQQGTVPPPLPAQGGTSQPQPQAGGAAEGAALRPLRVGEVGWFKVAGFPHWPFMVITREEAMDRGVHASRFTNPAYLAVQYFGTGEVQSINPGAVERSGRSGGQKKARFAPFLEGLELGYHAHDKAGSKRSEFRSSLFELISYLREGELPPLMLPWHNDGHGADGEDEGEAAVPAKAAPKRRKGTAAGGAGEPGALPMQLKSLTVLALGEVEWLHPAFHNEKFIFPVGYTAERLAKTPASGQQAVPHRVEVLRMADGSGPLFRVTPQGGAPVEGPTALKAWQALYACDAAGAARSLGLSGELMFGLALPRMQRAIQALPGAARCDRYCSWAEGQQPEAVPLAEREQRERLACEARMQALPEGVAAVPAAHSAAGVCHVCNEEEEDDEDLIVQCNKCHVFVHMSCYGVREPPHGSLWLCDVCSLHLQRPPPCVLCPVVGGAVKRTTDGRWAHPACALWLPETSLDAEAQTLHLRGAIQGIQQVHRTRFQLACQVCQRRHGACTQCCEPRCCAAFHPLCARQAGYKMEMTLESDCDSDEEGEDEAQAQQPPAAQEGQAQQAQQGQQEQCAGATPGGLDASCDENDAGAPNAGVPSRQRGGKQKRRQREVGVSAGVGVRLLAFCPKHYPVATRAGPALPPLGRQPSSAATAAAAGEDEHPSAWQLSVAAAAAVPASTSQQQQQQQQVVARHHVWGSARAAPFNHAARRGSRAPEAVEAAEAKREVVRSRPYLVGGPLQQAWAQVPATVHRPVPPGAGGQLQPVDLPPDAVQRGMPLAAASMPASMPTATPPRPRLLHAHLDGVQQSGSPAAGQARVLVSPRAQVTSDGARFAAMIASLGWRVTIGKSGIHGWGAFAKTRHTAHDMVIEYVGELVRPSVSDLREERLYNEMVGAGTYVFRLNRSLCVDATRAGNLAHMLNHSCDPNCYSRTISISEGGRGGGGPVDHVVIFAKRDIEPWEELTYDYRFAGEEQLPCNCGAAACRGRVNEKPPNWDEVWVRRSQLKPHLKPGRAQPAGPPPPPPPPAAQRREVAEEQ